jgi:methyl coenzyme M reductase subunit D
MKTEQVQIYEFKELSKEVQEKVLDKMRHINTDYEWWDSDLEDFSTRLEEIGLSCETFYFDIYDREFYMHKPRIEDLKKFLMSALVSNDAEKLLMKIEEKGDSRFRR